MLLTRVKDTSILLLTKHNIILQLGGDTLSAASLTGIHRFTRMMKNVTMGRLTVSLTDEEEEIIEEKVGDGGEYESKSEFVRMCIQDHTRVEDLEREVERLQNEKRTLLAEREEKAELARYVEDERETQQRWREAPLWTRMKWRVVGMPSSP